MIKVGAASKTRKLTRICVVLGVILLLSSFGMTLTAAASNENAPGQDQCDAGHGANDKPCVEDPSENGQDCDEHGNGGVNENHCIPDGGTTGGETSTGGSSTGEGTGNATGNSTGGSSTGEGTGNATGNSTGEGTGNATGNATGNSTGEGTGNATGNATGNSTGEGTGNATGNATGNSTGEGTGNATGNSTGEGTGSSTGESTTGGTETGTTTTPTVVEDNKLGDEVLGRVIERAPLATTGNETTVLAVIGFALLMLGSLLRFGTRFVTR